jgi:hypothetical protein
MAKNPTIMTLRRELDFQSFIRGRGGESPTPLRGNGTIAL